MGEEYNVEYTAMNVDIVRVDFSPPDQCPVMFCFLEPHEGDLHVDYTGCTFNSVTGEIISGHDGE